MIGRWYYAIPKHGATQMFRTPFRAFMALEQLNVEGGVYTQHSDGPRVHLGHRTEQGEWR